MDRTAFARARTFLSYNPLAKWTSLVASVGTGVLYVVLLLLLALFADLTVYRGQIPAYGDLPAWAKLVFQDTLTIATEGEVRTAQLDRFRAGLKDLGITD